MDPKKLLSVSLVLNSAASFAPTQNARNALVRSLAENSRPATTSLNGYLDSLSSGNELMNEFGDFSPAEYEATCRKEQDPDVYNKDRESVADMTNAMKMFDEMMAASNSLSYSEQAERNSRLQMFKNECANAYEGFCAQFEKEPDATRFEAFSNNYIAMRVCMDETGEDLRFTKYADCSMDELEQMFGIENEEASLPIQEGEQAIPFDGMSCVAFKLDQLKMGQQARRLEAFEASQNEEMEERSVRSQDQQRGTRVVRGTEVIGMRDDQNNPFRPTQVISRNNNSSRGTRVIKSELGTRPVRGTQTVRTPDSQHSPFRPTQVISRHGVRGTQVIQTPDDQNAPYRSTHPISRNDSPVRATKVVRSDEPNFGTRPVRKTRVVNAPDESSAPFRPTYVINGNGTPTRATEVIKPIDSSSQRKTITIPDALASASVQVGNEAFYSPPRATKVVKQVDLSSSETMQVATTLDELPVRPTEAMRKSDANKRSTIQIDETMNGNAGVAGGPYISGKSTKAIIRGTLVIEQSDEPFGTKVAQSSDVGLPADEQSSLPNSGTRVIQQADDDSTLGTRVIQQPEGSFQGTRVVKAATSNGFSSGTQVIQTPESNISDGTRVIRSAGEGSYQGTRVVKSASSADFSSGTRVIRRAGSADFSGTRVIKRIDEETNQSTRVIKAADGGFAAGTRVIRSGTRSVAEGTRVIKSETSRGTIVIPRSIEETNGYNPDSSIDYDGSNGNGASPDMPVLGSSSLFSFFGGTRKPDSLQNLPIRGTIALQNPEDPSTSSQAESGRQTILIEKSKLDETVPSIVSFFGGAKKGEHGNRITRATQVIKEESSTEGRGWMGVLSNLGSSLTKSVSNGASFGNDPRDALQAARLERQRLKSIEVAEERRQELEWKKLAMEQARNARRTVAVTRPPERRKSYSLSADERDIPEVRNWKQNGDGSITGYIHNSKSFRDGTRVTTTPVPNGSTTQGSIVETGSGTKYVLA